MSVVIVDSREPPWVQFEVATGSDIDKVIVTPLKEGDIMLVGKYGTALIERKGAMDLVQSLSDGRLIEQPSRMVEGTGRFNILVSHGSLLENKDGKMVADGRTTQWPYWSVQMAIFSIQAGGMYYIHLPNQNQLGALCKHLLNWLNREQHLVIAERKTIQFLKPEPGEEIVASLPGIGRKRAQALLKYFGSPAWVLVGLTQNKGATYPPGVGAGISAQVKKVLGLKESEEMHIG